MEKLDMHPTFAFRCRVASGIFLVICISAFAFGQPVPAAVVDIRPRLALQATHYANVNAAAISSNSRVIATAGEDWNVKLWDSTTGRIKQTLIGHTSGVTSISFSPDAKLIVSGSVDGTANVWDVATGSIIFSLVDPERNLISAVSFSRSNALIATATEGGGASPSRIRIWDITKRTLQLTIEEGSQGVNNIAFSENGVFLFSGSKDGKVKVWDFRTGESKLDWNAHTDEVSSLALSPDGELLATGSPDGTVKLWTTSNGSLRQTIAAELSEKNAVTFSPDNRRVAIGNSDIKVYDVTNGVLQTTLEKKTLTSLGIFYSPSGAIVGNIGVSTGDLAPTTEVFLWDADNGKFLRKMDGYRLGIISVLSLPSNATFITANVDRSISFWSLSNGAKIRSLQMPEEIKSLSRSHTGKLLAISGGDFGKPGSITIVDVHTGKLVKSLRGHLAPVREATFSPNGRWLASCSEDGTLKLWSAKTWQEEKTIRVGTLPALAIAFSRDSRLLFVGSLDGTVKIFNFESGELVNTFKGQTTGVYTVAVSPSGKLLASGGANTNGVNIWNLSNGALALTIRDTLLSPTSIRFLGESAVVVSNANGRVVRLNIENGTMAQELTVHELNASSIDVLPDLNYAITGSHDRSVHLVNLASSRRIITFYDPPSNVIKAASPSKKGEFLTIDSNGFYVATQGAENVTTFRISSDLLLAKDLHATYFRPNRIVKVLADR
jgi:WD40 repeat protein